MYKVEIERIDVLEFIFVYVVLINVFYINDFTYIYMQDDLSCICLILFLAWTNFEYQDYGFCTICHSSIKCMINKEIGDEW